MPFTMSINLILPFFVFIFIDYHKELTMSSNSLAIVFGIRAQAFSG